MRYERKYPFKKDYLENVFFRLKAAGYQRKYPRRSIFSIYYDTEELQLFIQSEAGIDKRLKKRIRWYSSDNILTLENKIKNAELGYKILEKDFSKFSSKFTIDFKNPIDKNKYEILLPTVLDQIYFPQVAVSYNREYLISICGNIRVTIDFDIKFAKVNSSSKNSVNNWIPSNEEVMEIKYDENDDYYCSNLINNIVDQLGLTTRRFSKYCNAISFLF